MTAQMVLPGLPKRRNKTEMKYAVRGRLDLARRRTLLKRASRRSKPKLDAQGREIAGILCEPLLDARGMLRAVLISTCGREKAEAIIAAAARRTPPESVPALLPPGEMARA